MKLLIISQYFWPENFRINDLAIGLQDKNVEVTILTANPNYPNKKMYKNLKLDNKYYNMEIIRAPIISRGDNKISLFLNYFSFVFSALFVGYFRLLNKKFDIIFVFQPSPITTIIPALIMSKLKNTKTVVWVLDLWPDTLKPMGFLNNYFLKRFAFLLSNFIYSRADLILAQSASMSKLLQGRLPNSNIKHLPNWVEEELFSRVNISAKKKSDQFHIYFAGNIGLAQDFDSMIKAIELIEKKDSFQITIIGDGKEKNKIQQQVQKKGLTNVIYFKNTVPLKKIANILQQADALILSLKKAEVFEYTIPGKLQSYLAIGLPIISMLSGESANIIQENKLGLNAKSGDYKGLAKNIIQIKNMSKLNRSLMGQRCKEYAEVQFKREIIIDNFIKEVNLIR